MPAAARLYLRGRIWWTWFYDENDKRVPRSTRCRDKRAAEVAARRLERRAADPAHPTSSPPLIDACKRFLATRKNLKRAADTLEYYRTKLGHLCRVLGDDRPLDEIDPIAVDEYIEERVAEGGTQPTISKELAALRSVLRGASRRGEYHGNPDNLLPEGWGTGYVPRKRTLTPAQAKRLVLAVQARHRARVAFLFATGARWGESDRAERVDFAIARGSIHLRGTKTKKAVRDVPVFKHVTRFARMAHDGAAKHGTAYPKWGNARRDLRAACVRAGLPEISPNDLRRSCSTWLIERGVPSNLVALYLGHSTSRMVELVYGRVEGEQLANAFVAAGVPVAAARYNAATARRRK